MLVPYEKVRRDFLALRGESPDLLPVLEEGEDSAVLTLDAYLRAALPEMAVKATLQVYEDAQDSLDEIGKFEADIEWNGRVGEVRLPDDYLRLYYLKLEEWCEAVRRVEPKDSLRDRLRGMMPAWMACDHRPMVVEINDEIGKKLRIYGGSRKSRKATVLYIPVPLLSDGGLRISTCAYHNLFSFDNKFLS